MAASLCPEEEQAAVAFLKEVNQPQTNGQTAPTVTWEEAVKFLMARKFELPRALDLYRNHRLIRQREGLINLYPLDKSVQVELLSLKFTILPARDSSGAAIALFTARYHNPASTSHQAVLKALMFQLDSALESTETQRNGLVFIYDMTGSKYSNFDYDLSIKILDLLKGGFPARLKKVLVVTAPLWFKAPFKILRLFVRQKLRDRVFTVNSPQLTDHIPVESLPKQLGGTLDVDHQAWLKHCLKHGAMKVDDKMFESFLKAARNDSNIVVANSVKGTSDNSPVSPVSEDLDSQGSKETVSEKHNHEEREKEVEEEKPGNEASRDMNGQAEVYTLSNSDESSEVGSPPCKRAVESSPDLSPVSGQLQPQLPRKKRPADADFDDGSIHTSQNQGMSIEEFAKMVKAKGKQGLYKEYAFLKAEAPKGTFNDSKARHNLPKNRYTDVLCLDHSRVRLECIDGDPTTDYINANFVDGYKQRNAYISTQGPLPKSFDDFWRMVWEQQALIIVMTTKAVERNRVKCGQYWPNEEDTYEQYGDLIVINTKIELNKDYTVSTLVIQNPKTEEHRTVTHFQFTSWPDYGVPHSASGFLDFMFRVRRHQEQRVSELGGSWKGHPLGPPIIIHCSAGIGRTGTFITMDICTKWLADDCKVDVESTVQRIRSQRAFSIQMPDQYVFCHLALLEHAQREGVLGEIDLDGFDDSESESD
ncbi:tyrosine-protein phosphatase non-receptor type 9 isoform X1 [Lingula anatina]|uniref:Tyrosine-protein phosphatase non-receptor type 9 n=1 Tax=Lingula anatina TaxID=7574 RepID=A0A1S3IZQ0_LINAN|nr:tyrosine-protein phosphatase non-receptor type 9 isoform X1 [Lingula anatina]|eukprot:XP_013403670.1 tyrosine-protein phosphatase non-receptor type 9 isoform X1 [Lingula anatina]